MEKNNIIIELLKKNLIQFGKFILKNGKESNIYIDLRSIISFPKICIKLCKFSTFMHIQAN